MTALVVASSNSSVLDGKYYPRWRGLPRVAGSQGCEGNNYYGGPLWLNALKQAGSNGPIAHWFTGSGTQFDTGEEAYLQLDANGDVTSLVAGNGFSGTQQFTKVFTYIYKNMVDATPPGATYAYTPGSWTLAFNGPGTFSLANGDASSVATSTPGVSVSGTTVTSTLAMNQQGIVTFTAAGNNTGFVITITSLANDGVNYLKFSNGYLVPTSMVSDYLGGELLHPNYKAVMAGSGFKGFNGPIRMMGAQNTYNQDFTVAFTAGLAQGATSGTIKTISNQANSYSYWPFATGTKKFIFATGQIVSVSGTYGSANVTWSTGLSAAIATNATGAMAMCAAVESWANRSKMSDFTWSQPGGPPIEAMVAIANELGVPPWLCVPGVTSLIDTTWTTSFAQLLKDGAGADITGSVLPSFSGLLSWLRVFVEFSNETWNYGSGYRESNLCSLMGVVAGYYAAQGNNEVYGAQEWYGTQVAAICDAFSSVFGSDFQTRVAVVCMNQFATGNGTTFMDLAMNTPDAGSAAYTRGIAAKGVAPYFGIDGISGLTASVTTQPTGTLVSGTYYIAVTGGSGSGATAAVNVSGGAVTSVGFSPCGSGYKVNDVLTVPMTGTGGATSGFTVTVTGGDAQVIMALADPVSEIIGTAYSNRGPSGNTYGSISTTGWAYDAFLTARSLIASFAGQSWANLPVVCYEGGSALDDARNIGSPWRTVLTSVTRDPRFQYLYYDPTGVLNPNYPGYLEAMRGLGISFICQLGVVGASIASDGHAGGGGWGAIESPMQTISPLSSAPSKYQGLMNFVAAGAGS